MECCKSLNAILTRNEKHIEGTFFMQIQLNDPILDTNMPTVDINSLIKPKNWSRNTERVAYQIA